MGWPVTDGATGRAWLASRVAASTAITALFVTLGAVGPTLVEASPGVGPARTTSVATPAAGNDVSWPQCGSAYPGKAAFGIVGINGGLPNDLNSCFAPSSSYPSYTQSELYWALADSTSYPTPAKTEPKASIYVNTADPGNVYNHAPVADWPKTGTSPLYGACKTTTYTYRHKSYTVGQDSPACAWVYGHNNVTKDLTWLVAAAAAITKQESGVPVSGAASAYPWWLDVETGNSWQAGTSGLALNVADLQGVVETLRTAGVASVGVYSTSAQWKQIAGTTTSSTQQLYGVPDWVPGATSAAGAATNCALSPFTGGTVQITQWTATFDEDHDC